MQTAPVPRRVLGGALRRYRENLGFGLEEAAKVLDCDRSKISRIETGQRGIRPKELRELLTEYGVPEQEQAALVVIACSVRARGWWQQYGNAVTEPSRQYFALEQAADQICMYAPQQVPDLLQTPEYANAIADAVPALPSTATQDMLVDLKLVRQHAVLHERQPELAVLIGEGALCQMVGGPRVMGNQLQHLAAASNLPQVTIQVVPFACGAHPGGSTGPVAILRFADAPSVGVVHLAGLNGGVSLVTPADVSSYTSAFEQLRATALTPIASAQLIQDIAAPMLSR